MEKPNDTNDTAMKTADIRESSSASTNVQTHMPIEESFGSGLQLGISLQSERPESLYHSSRETNRGGYLASHSLNQSASPEPRQKVSQELHDGERVEVAITIFRPADVVYSFWRDFSNIPKFMKHVSRLDVEGPNQNQMRWHWQTLAGFEIRWDAEIIDDVVDKLISWKTLPGTAVQNAGSVWFRPVLDGEATEVVLRLMYHIPGGRAATALAEAFGESPQQVLKEDLKRLRCLLEGGKIDEESIFDSIGLGLSDANAELIVPPIH